MLIESPCLWSPEDPYLYDLDIMVHNEQGKVIDGYRQRVGIRSIEFKQNEGLWINGKPYDGKLMGTNRHQDFAVLGNALPNSMQWRDAKKLRDAGLKVIRTHYVIDPAFMDACDELGVFALVEVPGWQFWNNESVFGERVYSDIRNMIRIHRNHASLFFWLRGRRPRCSRSSMRLEGLRTRWLLVRWRRRRPHRLRLPATAPSLLWRWPP